MAVVMTVTGLRSAMRRMRRAARTAATELPPVVNAEMGKTLVEEIVRGSKRPSRPRRARFVPKGAGGYVEIGWYGRDFSAVDDYLERPLRITIRRGFRRGARKARARFRTMPI